MRFTLLFTLLCVLGSVYSAETKTQDDFYFVFFLDVFDIPSPFALLNLFLDQPIQIEEAKMDPIEPDFSGIIDASQCEDVPVGFPNRFFSITKLFTQPLGIMEGRLPQCSYC